MNKLKTTGNGGFPLELDDFRFWEEGEREALKGLASAFGDNFILSGVQLVLDSGSEYNYTAGYVVVNGEVCRVDASAATIDLLATPYLYMELEITYHPDGNEVFENNIAQDTYEVRKAVINGYAAPQPGLTAYGLGFNTAANIVDSMILGHIHNFSERQSWAQGDDSSILATQDFIGVILDTGNAFNVNIDAVNADIKRFSQGVQNGTWIAIRFTGAGGKQIRMSTGVGTNRIETNGVDYFFKAGETAVFVRMSGAYVLVNPPINAIISTDPTQRIRTKVVEIGAWNMDTTQLKTVAHGLPDFTKILYPEASIINDAGTAISNLAFSNTSIKVQGGVNVWDATHIYLLRTTGESFDDAAYSSTADSRGRVTIFYSE